MSGAAGLYLQSKTCARGARAFALRSAIVLGLAIGLPSPETAFADDASAAVPGGTLTATISTIALGDGAGYLTELTELGVLISSNAKAAIDGEVVATMTDPNGTTRVTTAPFSIPPGATVVLHVPVSAKQAVEVEVRTMTGLTIARSQLSPSTELAVRVLDLGEVSRVRAAVDGVSVGTALPLAPAGAPTYTGPPPRGRSGPPATAAVKPPSTGPAGPRLRVASTRVDPTTGTPIVPALMAGYMGVDLVVGSTDVVSRLSAQELEALAGFVLGGGTLALRVAKPEDLRSPLVLSLIGGEAQETPTSPETLAPIISPSAEIVPTANPGDEVKMRGFSGGNLAPSTFGATAAYGLGEVVLLGFDPYDPVTMDDLWVRARTVELARRAHDRIPIGAASATREPVMRYYFGKGDPSSAVSKLLDPNQAARWGIAVASLLICGYAVVAGPIVFGIARKKNRPLAALRILPLASAIAFAIIVLLGFVAKGAGKSVHRLTMVDAGAGMSQGVAHRYRGFFSPSAQTLDVGVTARASSLKISAPNGLSLGNYAVERNGMRLVGYEATPSQTVLVREAGLATLGDGISIREGATFSELTLTNHTGRTIRGIVIKLPDDTFRFVRELADGASVASADMGMGGKLFQQWSGARPAKPPISVSFPNPDFAGLSRGLREADEGELGKAWEAMGAVSGEFVDWFPKGVPVVLAGIDGGEGAKTDSGVRVARDMLIVRVIGWGGAP